MNQFSKSNDRRFVVATPGRSVCDDNARALEHHGLLRFLALATRRGSKGIPNERTRLNPAMGLAIYAFGRYLPPFTAESMRFRLHPWFDRWVKRQLQSGDHIISSYGYANDSFAWVRRNGGKTFLDGGNSHPKQFWETLTEEHRRWKCPVPPIAKHHHDRSVAMMEHVDYVLSPSSFVTKSFLERGFNRNQILRNVYPTDLSCFRPPAAPRPKDRPLTIINTGSLSLRKGTPYMLEAFRLIKKQHPSARFLLTHSIQESAASIVKDYSDLQIQWSPPLPHPKLAERLQSADIFVLPSLEEGLARTALEAIACGLPAILTPNTGVNEFIEPGINGDVVPIRDARAIAEAALRWGDKIMHEGATTNRQIDTAAFSFENFEKQFLAQLRDLGLIQ